MLPAMPWRISSAVGSGFEATSAAAETTWPGVQKPHCTASARTKASTSGWSRSPSIVVTSPCTECASVMQESTGTPSTCTVHAPQWPSLQAIFVPVSPTTSRSACARLIPIGASISYTCSLTVSASSGTGRHRHDVGEMNEPEGRARDHPSFRFVLRFWQRAPQLARREQQLADLIELRDVAVALVRRVEREAKRAEGVLL